MDMPSQSSATATAMQVMVMQGTAMQHTAMDMLAMDMLSMDMLPMDMDSPTSILTPMAMHMDQFGELALCMAV